MNFNQLLAGLSFGLLLSSCNFEDLSLDKVRNPELSPNLAIYLGEATYTIDELLEDIQAEGLTVTTDEQEVIHFIYEQEVNFDDTGELISIGSVSNTAQYTVDTPTPPLPFEQTVPFEQTFDFEFSAGDGERIDSIFFSSGRLEYEMVSTFPASIDYDWVIINTKDISNDEDLAQSGFLNYTGSQVTDSYSRSLVGLKVIIEQIGGLNQFNVELEGDFTLPAGEGLETGQSMDFELAYIDPGISSIFGNFGNQVVEMESVDFELSGFEEYSGVGLTFTEPSISLVVNSSFGIEMLLNFDNITAIYDDASQVSLTNTIPESERLIRAPEVVGESRESVITINSENSNLSELLTGLPSQVQFAVSAEANPAVSTLTSNFLTDSSNIDIRAVVDIPLTVRMDGFEVDFEFELSGLEEVKEADSLALQMIITNEIPLEGTIRLEMLDEFGESLGIIGEPLIMLSPEVDANGRSLAPAVSNTGINLSSDEIASLLNANMIRAIVGISTFGASENIGVSILSTYEIKIELGLASQLVLEL